MRKLVGLLLLTSCATTARVVRNEPELKTLGVKAGRYGEKLYKWDLIKQAEKICPKGYEVTYKGRKPPTLENFEKDTKDYFWVIRCLP